MADNGYVLNIPVYINGGEGPPSTLRDRELYFDSKNEVLYCGKAERKPSGSVVVTPVEISVADLSSKISSYLEDSNEKKTLKNAEILNLQKVTVSSNMMVNSIEDLNAKPAGLYFIKSSN